LVEDTNIRDGGRSIIKGIFEEEADMLFDDGFKPEEVNIDKQIYWQIFPEFKGMEFKLRR